MKDFKNLDLSKLRLSHQKKWDKKSVILFLPVSSYGDERSGNTYHVVAKLHGEDSVVPTGVVTIQGVALTGYGSSHFKTGKGYSVGYYYEGMCDFSTMADAVPNYKVVIEGATIGALEALLRVADAEPAELLTPDLVNG